MNCTTQYDLLGVRSFYDFSVVFSSSSGHGRNDSYGKTPRPTDVWSTNTDDVASSRSNDCFPDVCPSPSAHVSIEANQMQPPKQVSQMATVFEPLPFKTDRTQMHVKARQAARKATVCVFCRANGECLSQYGSHLLKDDGGRVTCPVLRRYTCPICGASGDYAHTIKYCPVNSATIR